MEDSDRNIRHCQLYPSIHLFADETSAGLHLAAIYFYTKDSPYANPERCLVRDVHLKGKSIISGGSPHSMQDRYARSIGRTKRPSLLLETISLDGKVAPPHEHVV